MVHVGWVAGCYTYSRPVRVPHWSLGGGIQTTHHFPDFVHNGSYGVGGWMMNFHSIGGHRGFEGWWGMYVLEGAHYTHSWDTLEVFFLQIFLTHTETFSETFFKTSLKLPSNSLLTSFELLLGPLESPLNLP